MVRIVVMGLHSCSEKKCGGGADCLAAVDLSVFLKLPACLFVCARLFPCFPARSFGLSASWRVLECFSDPWNTHVVYLSLGFSFLSKKDYKWILVKLCIPVMLLCCGVFHSQWHCRAMFWWGSPRIVCILCFMHMRTDMDSQHGRTQSGFWCETFNVNKIVLVDNENSTGYLFKSQTVAPRLGRFRYCVCVCMRTCCVLISQTRPRVEDELRVGYLQAAGHL